jgi:hypothetical protein
MVKAQLCHELGDTISLSFHIYIMVAIISVLPSTMLSSRTNEKWT